MTDLAVWLLAQLDADEQVALAVLADLDRRGEDSSLRYDLLTRDGDTTTIRHLPVYDPSDVLVDISGRRALIAAHQDVHVCACYYGSGDDWKINQDAWIVGDENCDVLTLLASVYAVRPGFRDEWKHSSE